MKRYIGLITLLCVLSFSLKAQNNVDVQLANEYYSKGEFEKAKSLYEDLAKNLRNISLIHSNYYFLLLKSGDFKEAEKYIKNLNKKFPAELEYRLDLGLLYQYQAEEEKADKYFKDIIAEIKGNTFHTRVAAEYFINKQLNQYAVLTYQQARKNSSNDAAFGLELANLYRIMNKKDEMVEEYLNYITQNPSNVAYVENTLQNLLTTPEEYEALENLLLDKIQKNPDSQIFSELLIWVNLQQKNFYGAFVQARAVDKRLKTGGAKSLNIGFIALDNKDYNTAIKIFDYVINEFPDSHNQMLAKMYLIKAYEQKVKNTYPVELNDIVILIEDYQEFIDESGMSSSTLEAMRSKALLHAFYLDQRDSAITLLKKIINTPRANSDIVAQSKLDLGDIYLLDAQPWESTLLYSQVEKDNKESPLGYEAKLKNAKLSYFKGDFQLAQEHLDILKEATTREIANDAMALSILIKDNVALDSSETAMKNYAAIELLLFQHKEDSALSEIKNMLKQYSGHSLTDELLWKEAEIMKKQGKFSEAILLLSKIVEEYDYDILSDDAYFMIASIYDKQLNEKQKAMEIYRDFLTKYPGSVFVAEARKRFRALRGDYTDVSQQY